VTVTDANNCTAQTSVTITQPAALLTEQIIRSQCPLFWPEHPAAPRASALGRQRLLIFLQLEHHPAADRATANNLGGHLHRDCHRREQLSAQTSVTITQPRCFVNSRRSIRRSISSVLARTPAAPRRAPRAANGSSYSYSWNTTRRRPARPPITWARALTS
jgi:hypothetical protein